MTDSGPGRKVGSALYLGCIFAASWKIQPYLIKFGDDKEKEQKDQKREDPDSSPKGNTVETLRPQKIGDEDTELSSTNFPLFNGDSIFIPLGSSRPLPVAPYKGDDPEWQEFLRLNQDKGRVEDVKCKFRGYPFGVVFPRITGARPCLIINRLVLS